MMMMIMILMNIILMIQVVVGGSNIQHHDNNNNNEAKESTTGSTIKKLLRLGGYVPDYRIGMTELNQSFIHLDDVYIFSVEPKIINSYTVDITDRSCCINWNNGQHISLLQKAIQYKKDNSNNNNNKKETKIWLTIGGGGRSDTLLQMNRTAFVIEILKILKNPTTSFITGIDIDGEIRFTSQEEYIQYAKLLIYISKQLHKYSPRNTLVSVALHAQQYLPKTVYEYIDVINLMTYDMSNQIYHADLSLVESAIQNLISSGCPEYKIMIGIPAYGRNINSFHTVQTYNEIITDYIITKNNMKIDELDNTNNEFIKLNIWNQYQFESIHSLQSKIQMIQYKYPLIRGYFIWEIGQDKFLYNHPIYKNGIILSSIASIINEINYNNNNNKEEQDDDEVPLKQQQQQQADDTNVKDEL